VKKPFAEFTVKENSRRSFAEAESELQREIDVRKRLYDKWSSEGKVSWVEANDRLERLMTALALLQSCEVVLTQEEEA
jgi:hypothetical protein